MRADMHKVIVERPRWTPGPDKRARRANLSDELLPKFEGVKRPHSCRKGQRDLLGPLRRWLEAQVGRHWNDIYREACAVIHPDNYVRLHVKTHLLEFVQRNTFMHTGEVSYLDTGPRGGIKPVLSETFFRRVFYVHPESGRLEKIDPISRKQWNASRLHAPDTRRWIGRLVALQQIRGLWFECRFQRPDGIKVPIYDHSLERTLRREEITQHRHEYLWCVHKRQLSRRELRKYDLRNTNNEFNLSAVFSWLPAQSIENCAPRCSCCSVQFQPLTQEEVWQINQSIKTARFFEITSKRRKGFPSETQVKRGVRVVHGDKELQEKLGRNDPCPCGSGRSF